MRKHNKSQCVIGTAVIGFTLLTVMSTQAEAHQALRQGLADPQRHHWSAQHHGPRMGPGLHHREGWGHGTQ